MSSDYGQQAFPMSWSELRELVQPTLCPILAMLQPDPGGALVPTEEILLKLERAVHQLTGAAVCFGGLWQTPTGRCIVNVDAVPEHEVGAQPPIESVCADARNSPFAAKGSGRRLGVCALSQPVVWTMRQRVLTTL